MAHRAATHTRATLRVILVRHGETDSNRAFVHASHSHSKQGAEPGAELGAEPCLTELGQEQAVQVAAALKDVHVDEVISSSLVRAQGTATPIARLHGLSLAVDPLWVEFDERREDSESFVRRVTGLWASLIVRARTCARVGSYRAPWTIVVVTHSLLLSVLLGSTLKPSDARLEETFRGHTLAAAWAERSQRGHNTRALEFQTQLHFPNASISAVDFEANGDAHIVVLGYTAHLRALSGPHPLVAALSPFSSSSSSSSSLPMPLPLPLPLPMPMPAASAAVSAAVSAGGPVSVELAAIPDASTSASVSATRKQRCVAAREAAEKAKAAKPLVVVSLDIEADGPSPVTNSCLQLGLVVLALPSGDEPGYPVPGDYSWLVERRGWCLEPQPGRVADERCMEEFWANNKGQLAHIRAHAQPAPVVMAEFAAWYAALLEKYTVKAWVAKPASYDAQWLNALYEEFGPVSGAAPGLAPEASVSKPTKPTLPFSFTCLSTMYKMASLLGIHPRVSRDESLPHTHDAVDDAAGQAFQFLALNAAFKEAKQRLALRS
jgi:broad specificity phosphatase PhoE